MCGVGGIFAYHVAANKPAEAELLATRDATRARGLDGSGATGGALIGAAGWGIDGWRSRLVRSRSQPMASAERKLVVAFNGEIYNYLALRAELETFAPALPALAPGTGKAVLAKAPSLPLPAEIIVRAQTGFGLQTGAGKKRAAESIVAGRNSPSKNKGLVSRDWARAVLDAFAAGNPALFDAQRLAAAQ